MNLFRRRDKASSALANDATAGHTPEISGLNLSGTEALANLVERSAFATHSDRDNGTSLATSQSMHNPTHGRIASDGSSSIVSRNISQGAVPYHLPWTRTISSASPKIRPSTTEENFTASVPFNSFQRQRQRGVLPSSTSNFRISTVESIASTSTSPQQRRQMIETGRRKSLKRSRAPTELNVVVAGACNTGKTSWIRTLLSTCDLSRCPIEAIEASSLFGIHHDNGHPTRCTDPPTPLPTTAYDTLHGIELDPDALIPIPVLASQAAGAKNVHVKAAVTPQPRYSTSHRRLRGHSIASTRAGGLGGTNKVQLSLCDTPGIDFELEDTFEIERKVSSLLRHVESRFTKTLAEENKVQRIARSDEHVHLILFFIDPRFIVEDTEARRKERERVRLEGLKTGTAVHNDKGARKAVAGQQQVATPYTRARSTSESASGSKAAALASASTHQSQRLRGSHSPPMQGAGVKSKLHGGNAKSPLSQQLAILARLCRRANVLPIIAKADTLTAAQLEDARVAIQHSILEGGINLGTFALHKDDSVTPPHRRDGHREGGRALDPTEEDSSSGDQHPIKVIKIKPRRSYSVTKPERPTFAGDSSQKDGDSASGHGSPLSDSPDRPGSVRRTVPLFDSVNKDDILNEGDGVRPLDDALPAPKVPLSIFVPEPIRIREPELPCMAQEDVEEVLPPVPPLPSDLARERVSSMSTESSEIFSAKDVPPVARASSDIEDGTYEGGQGKTYHGNILEGAAEQPNSRDHPAAAKHTWLKDVQISQSGRFPDSQTASGPSRRYVRDFCFGQANVLDPAQCDFDLLRTCLLGTHVCALRDSTAQYYEQFRSERLELQRFTLEESAAGLTLGGNKN